MEAILNIPINVPSTYPLETLKKQLTEYAKTLIAKSREENNVLLEENLSQAFPEDLMQQVAEYAINEHESGRCIPNSNVKDIVIERLGWK